MRNVLRPFKTATDATQGDAYITISMVYTILVKIKSTHLLVDAEHDSELVQLVKKGIEEQVVERFKDPSFNHAVIATGVDPRFKDFTFIDAEDRGAHFTMVLNAAKQQALVHKEHSNQQAELPSVTSDNSVQPRITKKQRVHQELMELISVPEKQTSMSDAVEHELAKFWDVKVSITVDPLMWWRMHSAEYPILSTLARKYLAIPATSAPAERVFSIAGDVVSKKRNRLKPDIVDKIIFVHDNLVIN